MGDAARPLPNESFYTKGLEGHIDKPRCELEMPWRVDAKRGRYQ